MASPIERLIDATVRCVKCGKPPGCDCWVLLRCPSCGRQKYTERADSEPPGETVELECPECW